MADTLVEINDSGIRVSQQDTIVLESPGYAVLNKDRLYLGNEARELSSSNPRQTCNRFWSNLNQEPLPIKSKRIRHHADLAYAHLLDIHAKVGKPDKIIFIVPSYYNREHLSLLLGLVEASPFRADGLIDAAVAAAAGTVTPGTYYHLEIYLHHFTVTKLEIDREIGKIETEINDAAGGLLGIYEVCVNYIADQFITQTRFDPLRHAETERALYDQLPSNLASLCERPEAPIRLEFADTGHTVKIKSRQLLEKLNPLYEKITQTLDPELCRLVSHRLAVLPGFTNALGRYIVVDEHAVFNNCRFNLPVSNNDNGAFHLIDRLPVAENVRIAATAPVDAPAPPTMSEVPEPETTPVEARASHVLCDGHACKIGPVPLILAANGVIGHNETTEPHCVAAISDGRTVVTVRTELTVFKNGAAIDSTVIVKPGDIISFAGSKTEYLFIAVAD